MPRSVPLAADKEGINRLKNKGGASLKVFYDLENARLDQAGGVVPRPGLVVDATVPGTKGLFGYGGLKHVFAAAAVAVPPGYRLNILPHPTTPSRTIAAIPYVGVMLGRLFVVARFDNGDVYYYWLTNPSAWAPNAVYGYRQNVQPVVVNGFYYAATNTDTTTPLWAAGQTKAVGNFVQPTTHNGYLFEATAVAGTAPVRTSTTEPTWPTADGATVVEYNYGGTLPPAPSEPSPTYPPNVEGEYAPFRESEDPNIRTQAQ